MARTSTWLRIGGAAVLVAWGLGARRDAAAHCDTVDGPVATEARAALEAGDVTPTLKWVRPEDEAAIRQAFALASAARRQGGSAKEMAETFFAETLARVHRVGEGEGFEGLRPAGSTPPIVAAADRSLAAGTVDDLTARLRDAAVEGLRSRFDRVIEARKRAGESVPAGRAYVAAYGEYVHYVERLHDAIVARGGEHPEASPGPAHAEGKH